MNKRTAAFLTALTALTVLVACMDVTLPTTTPAPAPTIVVTQNQNSHNSGPVPVSPGSPTEPTSGAIYKVKTGFFGGVCPGGNLIAPGQTDLKVGCAGTVTATPKVMNPDGVTDRDATVLEHGSDDAVEWFYDFGADKLASARNGSNNFNRNAEAKAAGAYRLCARVRGVVGCVEGTVTQ
jgi:hypothetical protein